MNFHGKCSKLEETEHKLEETDLKVKELQTIVQMSEYKNNNLKDTDKCIVCIENERNAFYTACTHLSTCSVYCSKIGY